MSAPVLDEHDTMAWRLCEADLISGVIELSVLARDGIPPGRRQNFPEPPAEILERLFGVVAPTDLTRMGGGIWVRAQRSWRKHGVISWDHIRSGAPEATRGVTRFYESYGMGLGLQAPVAAERLLNLRAALDGHKRAREEAASALHEASASLRDVPGVG